MLLFTQEIALYLWISSQIIVEVLPISSSSHLLFMELLFKKYRNFDITAYFERYKISKKTIYYFLHWPTFIVILLYFWPQLFSILFGCTFFNCKPFVWVVVADGITAFFFLLAQRIPIPFSLGLGLIITAASLFYTAFCTGNKELINWDLRDAFILGCAQSIAILPGISRLAFTCAVGCWLGYSLIDAFFLSWLLQLPLMAAACLKSVIELRHSGNRNRILNWYTILIMIGSGCFSWYVLRGIIFIINAKYFYLLGWYMIIPFFVWLWLAK